MYLGSFKQSMGRSQRLEDDDFLRAIALSPDPVVTAKEIGQQLNYSTDGARDRLEKLEEKGLVQSREVGARAMIWWLTDDGRNCLSKI